MPSPHYETGKYRAAITGQRFGTLPTGTDYFALDFTPTESLGANELPTTIYSREVLLYFSEKAAPHSVEKLRSMGWNGARLMELEPGAPNHHSLIGTEIEVECGRNDKGYEDWRFSSTGGGQPKESDKGVAAKLDKLFGKALMASAAAKKAAPKKETVPPAGKEEDDDSCPF